VQEAHDENSDIDYNLKDDSAEHVSIATNIPEEINISDDGDLSDPFNGIPSK
jgi:hypothetical protein